MPFVIGRSIDWLSVSEVEGSHQAQVKSMTYKIDSLTLGIKRTGYLNIKIMWLSRKWDYDPGGLVSQWGSTIKSV